MSKKSLKPERIGVETITDDIATVRSLVGEMGEIPYLA